MNEKIAFDFLKKVTIPKGKFKTVWSIVYNINQKSISFFTDTHKAPKTIHLSELDYTNGLSYYNLNQSEVKILDKELKSFTEQDNYRYLSPSLIHLGFNENVAKEMSLHQFQPTEKQSRVFADDYFHFEISISLEEEKQMGFLAIMDSEQHFNERKAVTGGYLYNNVGKGTFVLHIYGLKKGKYAMLGFIDDNKNGKLDFGKAGKALEKYTTFGDKNLESENELTFANISADFDRTNATILITWKE